MYVFRLFSALVLPCFPIPILLCYILVFVRLLTPTHTHTQHSELTLAEKLTECLDLIPPLLTHVPNLIVSLGQHGVLACSAEETTHLHYRAAVKELLPVGVVSVTGAGDR